MLKGRVITHLGTEGTIGCKVIIFSNVGHKNMQTKLVGSCEAYEIQGMKGTSLYSIIRLLQVDLVRVIGVSAGTITTRRKKHKRF